MLRFLFACTLLLATLTSAGAQGVGEISPLTLVGRWTASAQHPDGTLVVSNVTFTQNQKFSGNTEVRGRAVATYTGTWSISGRTLTWRYETNSGLSLAQGATDTDDIVSIDATKLVLRSQLSGRQHEYVRSPSSPPSSPNPPTPAR